MVGRDLAMKTGQWITRLSTAEVAELEQAADTFLATGSDIGEMRASEFPLPTLAPRTGQVKGNTA